MAKMYKKRKSSGCVVYRFNDGELQLLLVTNRSGKTWVFPKGGIEPDLDARESAAKEVYEEAGALGIVGQKLGKYRYVKDGVMQKVVMFAMRWTQDSEDWPEAEMRQRDWFSFNAAMQIVPEHLAPFLFDLQEHLFDTK